MDPDGSAASAQPVSGDAGAWPIDVRRSVAGLEQGLRAALVDDEARRRAHAPLEACRAALRRFAGGAGERDVFAALLDTLVAATGSARGYLEELRPDATGRRSRRLLACIGDAWGDDVRERCADLADDELASAFGSAVDTFLGIPLVVDGDLVAMAGVADRPGGYEPELAASLGSLIEACARIVRTTRRVTGDREREAALAAMFERAPYMMFLVDRDVRIADVNRAAVAFAGREKAQLVGERFGDAIDCIYSHERGACGTAESCAGCPVRRSVAWTFAAGTGVDLLDVHLNVRPGDAGVSREVAVSTVPIRVGDSDRVLVSMVDVTERERSARERREALALLTSTLQSTADGILAVGSDGRIVYANDRFRNVWGLEGSAGAGDVSTEVLAHVADQVVDSEAFVARTLEIYADPMRTAFDTVSLKDGRLFERYSIPMHDGDRLVGRVWSYRDVSDRDRAERALRASEERYRRIVETASEGVLAVDEQDAITYVNAQMAAALGYRVEELVGRPAAEILFEEDLDDHQGQLRARAMGDEGHYERRVRHRDGSERWMYVSARQIVAPDGSHAGSFAMFTDITKRRQAERELRLTEFSVERSASPLLWIDNASGMIVRANPAACDLLGYAAEEIVGRSILDIDAGRREGDPPGLSPAASTSRGLALESAFRHRDGHPVPVDLVVSRILYEGHDYTIVSAHDLTERRRAEAALRESEAQIAAIIEHIPGLVYRARVRPGGAFEVVYASPGIVTADGFDPATLTGADPFQFVYPDDRERVLQSVATGIESGEAVIQEYRVVLPDGEERWMRDSGRPRVAESGEVVIDGVALDITETKRINDAMANAQKLESLGILAGGIAHDFNNMLVAILGNASLLTDEFPSGSPARDSVAAIQAAAERAADLSRQMLAYSGRGPFLVQPVDLSSLVAEMAGLVGISISKRARLETDLARGLPLVQGDATQLRQVVLNLVTNASEALGDSDGVITVRTGLSSDGRLPGASGARQGRRARAAASGDGAGGADTAAGRDRRAPGDAGRAGDSGRTAGPHVYLVVSDTGCGMDEATSSRIFDPFFTTKFTGRGLGLAAVQGIVRGHHGTIHVESTPGHGATFTVLLPVPATATATASPTATATGSSSAAAAPGARSIDVPSERPAREPGRGCVLIVDDEPSVARLARSVLERAGFTAIVAGDGAEAVRVVEANPGVHVVLLDLTMPGMDGRETADALRAVRTGLPIVITSGYSEREASERLGEVGAAGFVGKPYHPDDLVAAVAGALAAGAGDGPATARPS